MLVNKSDLESWELFEPSGILVRARTDDDKICSYDILIVYLIFHLTTDSHLFNNTTDRFLLFA
jgi:hypothetical protein